MIIDLRIASIKKIMVAKRISGKDLSNLTGIAPQTISAILKRGSCSIKNANLLAEALGVEVEEIWKED